MAVVRKISVFSHTVGGASMNVMKTIYNSCVRSHLQYAYAAWCCAKSVNKLEGVQNSALTLACGAMKNSSTEAMQVLCRVSPLKLRLEAYLISNYVKILSQPDTSPIKSLLSWLTAGQVSSYHPPSAFVWQQITS